MRKAEKWLTWGGVPLQINPISKCSCSPPKQDYTWSDFFFLLFKVPFCQINLSPFVENSGMKSPAFHPTPASVHLFRQSPFFCASWTFSPFSESLFMHILRPSWRVQKGRANFQKLCIHKLFHLLFMAAMFLFQLFYLKELFRVAGPWHFVFFPAGQRSVVQTNNCWIINSNEMNFKWNFSRLVDCLSGWFIWLVRTIRAINLYNFGDTFP